MVRAEAAHDDVLAWVERPTKSGWDSAPDAVTREACREAIIEQISNERGSGKLSDLGMGRAFTTGLLAVVA